MEIAKPIFYIVGSITLFGILGGLDPSNTIAEMAVRAVMVGVIIAGISVAKDVKNTLLEKI
jgi:hypothetical protein